LQYITTYLVTYYLAYVKLWHGNIVLIKDRRERK
jgi:hypothetical protein